MDLTVSIATHNNRALLESCMGSVVRDTAGLDAEIAVVVNTPGDGSADMLRARFPQAQVMENSAPMGFGANHNQVLQRARGRFVLVLNDDTVLHPGCLKTLMDFLQRHPDAGAAGPRVLNPDGSLQQSCYRLPTPGVLFYDAVFLSSLFPNNLQIGGYKQWPHDTVSEVGHVIGACMMIPATALERVGMFDEEFFLYFEEADWCRRALDAGLKTYFTPDAVITHHGGASISQLGAGQLDHFLTSMDRYYTKHFGRASLPGVYACNMFGAAARAALFAAPAVVSRRFREKQRHHTRRLAWYLRSATSKNTAKPS